MRACKKRVITTVALIFTILTLLCSCGSYGQTNNSTTVSSSTMMKTTETTNETATDYWEGKEIPKYAGTYQVEERAGGTINATEIKKTALGKIYEVELDLKTSSLESIEKSRLALGYFYVQGEKILRCDKSDSADVFVQKGEFPPNATVIFQDTEKPDSLQADAKGFHEFITVQGNTVVYHSYSNLVETGFYEDFFWEKGVGLIAYRSGFGAQRDELYVHFTQETVSSQTGIQPIIPLAKPNSTRRWPTLTEHISIE